MARVFKIKAKAATPAESVGQFNDDAKIILKFVGSKQESVRLYTAIVDAMACNPPTKGNSE